jgi:methionyl-tRNA synthetase
MIASETGNEVVWEEETNWKFRLGKFKDGLREWLSRPEGEFRKKSSCSASNVLGENG